MTELPDPGLPRGAGVRLRMVRAPVNPADLLALEGRYAFSLDPQMPLGAEGVGEVEAVGPQVHDLKPGMLALPLERGNWCSHRLLDRSAVMTVPPGIDPAQAAMMRINPATAMLLLDAVGLEAGSVVAQNGAGSGVAAWVRLFAARRGIRVVNIVRRPLSALPDAVIDGPDLADQIREKIGDIPLRAALDCVAGEATARLASCLAADGKLVVFGHLSGAPITIPSQMLTGGGLTLKGFSLRPTEAKLGRAGVQTLFDDIWRTVQEERPALPIRAIVAMGEAGRALDLARKGGSGRIMFDLTEV